MLNKIYDAIAHLLTFGVKTEILEKEVRELRKENREMLDIVRFLASEVYRVSAKQDSESERIELFIENQLLKFERRLPQKKSNDEKED